MAVEGEALLLEGDTLVAAAAAAAAVVVEVGTVDARIRITEAFWSATFLWIAGNFLWVLVYSCFGCRRGFLFIVILIFASVCRPEELRVPFERFGLVRDVYIPKDYYSG
jgi:hypothetical protein